MRIGGLLAAAVVVATSFTVVAASPSSAATGSLSVSDGVWWDEITVEQPYSWSYTPDPGYTYDVLLSVEVTGPDGYSAGSDFDDSDVPFSGSSTVMLLGDQMDGNYTLSGTIRACTSSYVCRVTPLPAQTFQMRLPRSKTVLRTRRSDVDPGQTVTLRAKVLDERPNGFFVTDYGYIWLERREGGRWRRIPGSKGFMGYGREAWSVRYKGGRQAYRAVTPRGDGHDASTSRVIVLR